MTSTVTITDPSHEFYGRVGVILSSNEWYTHVRVLYTSGVQILTSDQYKINEGQTS